MAPNLIVSNYVSLNHPVIFIGDRDRPLRLVFNHNVSIHLVIKVTVLVSGYDEQQLLAVAAAVAIKNKNKLKKHSVWTKEWLFKRKVYSHVNISRIKT